MKTQKFTFKSDKYRKARGGYSRFINIFCSQCGEYFLLYQKDGPGPLKRLYLDRIFAPEENVGLQKQEVKHVKHLACRKCNNLIGLAGIYKKENRKIYHFLNHTFTKKIAKDIYPVSGLAT